MRTVEDFVKDMSFRNRSDDQIRAVAISTRWEKSLKEVEEIIEEFSDGWREEGKTLMMRRRMADSIRFRFKKPVVKKRIVIRKKKVKLKKYHKK